MADVASGAVRLFGASLLFYHASELALVAYYEPEELSFSSLLLSPAYLLAMAAALLEFHIGQHLFPALKGALVARARLPGLALVVAGELLRKAAWTTARASFTHRIKVHKRPQHVLVTGGVYAWCRHPGYLGWGVWAIGTQVLLANGACALLFALVSWRFFATRIPVEEYHLRRIFGEPYVVYRRRTPTFMPGIP